MISGYGIVDSLLVGSLQSASSGVQGVLASNRHHLGRHILRGVRRTDGGGRKR